MGAAPTKVASVGNTYNKGTIMSDVNEARTAEATPEATNVNENEVATEATPEIEAAKVEAKPANKVTTPKAATAKRKPKAKAAFTATMTKQVAQRSWWRKASKEKLAGEFNLTEDQIDELRATKQYKETVASLLLSQWPDLETFNKWVKSYGSVFRNFANRMGLELKDANAMVEQTRKEHALIADGKRKAPKPVQNPHKKDS